MQHTNWDKQISFNHRKAFKTHLIIFLLVVPLMWLTWYLTGRNFPWPLWATAGWATGILFHYLGVFVFRKSKNV